MDEEIQERYLWWDLADMADYFAMVNKVGAENLREEIRRERGKIMRVLIDKRTGEPCGEYNYSHTCPIDCPD